MKDEIKEIFETIKECINENSLIHSSKWKLLLDYITNLQDRKKELETINEEHRKINGELRKENKKLLKKSYSDDVRITKAIEYIRQCQLGVDSLDRPYMLLDQEEGKELLNILQGSDE